jgi:probable addiction module antidote protein
MAKKPSTSYSEDLIQRLKDPEYAVEYLRATLEESDMPELFLQALRNVADSHGIAHVAEQTELNRESLYRMLSKEGNPTIKSLYAVLDALNLKLSIEPKDQAS